MGLVKNDDNLVELNDHNIIKRVTFRLHPTFIPTRVIVDNPPFQLRRIGWGVFNIGIIIEFHNNLDLPKLELDHLLCLSRDLKKDVKYILIDVNKALTNI